MDKKDLAQKKLQEIRTSVPIGIYQHYKGSYYTVYGYSLNENDLEILIHYYS
jgi:hypothetical protein